MPYTNIFLNRKLANNLNLNIAKSYIRIWKHYRWYFRVN